MVTVQIKNSSRQAKKLVEMLRTFPYVEIVETKQKSYNPKLIKKIRDAEKRADFKEVKGKELWESIK